MFKRLLPRFDNAADMTTAQNSINNATNAGNSAINSFDPTQTAGAQQQNTNNLFNTQQGQTQNYVNQYQQAVANNPSVTALYNQGNEKFNVPGLTNVNQYYQNKVAGVVPNSYQAAKGYDIDATDLANSQAQAMSYLGPQANQAQSNLNAAQGLAQGFVQAGQAQNAQNLLPIQAEQQNLLQQQAAQATGWNQAAKSQFDGLVAKMQSGVALSVQELQTAQQLAATEEAYNQQVATNTANIQQAQIGQQYKILTPAQTLINTFTGKGQKAS